MKEKIKKIKRLSVSKFTESELKYIYERTSYLENCSLSERCYHILNDLFHVQKCKECNKNKITFLRISSGYRSFCSVHCKNKWIFSNTNVKSKISESSKKSYNKFSRSEINEQQKKRADTMIKKGLITAPENKSDLDNYRRLIWKYTNSQKLFKLKNFEKRGRTEVKGAYQLDHKYSIVQGFRHFILPYYIGNINNLEMIPAIDNNIKKTKCSIQLEELFMTEMSIN